MWWQARRSSDILVRTQILCVKVVCRYWTKCNPCICRSSYVCSQSSKVSGDRIASKIAKLCSPGNTVYTCGRNNRIKVVLRSTGFPKNGPVLIQDLEHSRDSRSCAQWKDAWPHLINERLTRVEPTRTAMLKPPWRCGDVWTTHNLPPPPCTRIPDFLGFVKIAEVPVLDPSTLTQWWQRH